MLGAVCRWWSLAAELLGFKGHGWLLVSPEIRSTSQLEAKAQHLNRNPGLVLRLASMIDLYAPKPFYFNNFGRLSLYNFLTSLTQDAVHNLTSSWWLRIIIVDTNERTLVWNQNRPWELQRYARVHFFSTKRLLCFPTFGVCSMYFFLSGFHFFSFTMLTLALSSPNFCIKSAINCNLIRNQILSFSKNFLSAC